MLLPTHRKLLQSKAIAIENDLRGTLRNFGLKVGMVGQARPAQWIKTMPITACKLHHRSNESLDAAREQRTRPSRRVRKRCSGE